MGTVGAGAWSLIDWLLLVERELLAFAAFWFCVGLLDEFAIDLTWLGLRLRGKARSGRLPVGYGAEPLSGASAVLIPTYGESAVIGATIAYACELGGFTWRERTGSDSLFREKAREARVRTASVHLQEYTPLPAALSTGGLAAPRNP